MEWINIKDELPDKPYQRILVYSYIGNMHVVNYFKGNENLGTLWKCDVGFEGKDIIFTHWMPLPSTDSIEKKHG